LAGGAAIIVIASVVGGSAEAIARPPALVRAILVGVAVVIGFAFLARALTAMAGSTSTAGRTDVPAMIRGVRNAFLAVGAFVAAAGWMLGHPLLLVVALVVAGVDLVETTFLLLVVTVRSRNDGSASGPDS
jgi:hypothetical protein